MNIYAVLNYFAQPAVLIYLGLGAAIARAWFARPDQRQGLRSILFFYLLVIVMALPVTGHFVMGGLERQNPPKAESVTGADAIVVLSGDVLQPNVLRPEA